MKTPYKCSLTYLANQNCFCQTLPTFCWREVKNIKVLMRSTNKANNSFLVSKQAYKRRIDQWLCRTTMGRGGQTWVKAGNFFDWLEIYEPITYFSFSTRIFRNRNMLLDIPILILTLTLKSIKMKETTINSSIPPKTDLETNFTISLRRNYLLNPQLSTHETQYSTLQSSFPWWIFSVARIYLHRVTGYLIATELEPTTA